MEKISSFGRKLSQNFGDVVGGIGFFDIEDSNLFSYDIENEDNYEEDLEEETE